MKKKLFFKILVISLMLIMPTKVFAMPNIH